MSDLAQIQTAAESLTSPAAILGFRVIGAVAGTTLAFLVAWPKNTRDFAVRLVASMLVGTIFGPVVRGWLQWPPTPEMIVAGATVTAFFGWAALGAGVLAFDKYGAAVIKKIGQRSP